MIIFGYNRSGAMAMQDKFDSEPSGRHVRTDISDSQQLWSISVIDY